MEPPNKHVLHWVSGCLACLCAAQGVSAATSGNEIESLTNRSAIVVAGTVLKIRASADPMLVASDKTATVEVGHMYAGQEIAGDQTGVTMTVILHDARAVKAGDSGIFFGNPRFVGAALTIEDVGEIFPAAGAADAVSRIDKALQVRRDQPLRDQLAVANRVFKGRVETIRPLRDLVAGAGAGAGARAVTRPADEHDPEWQVATVRVTAALRGVAPGELSRIIFAASRDITWFKSPKLKVGDDAVFLARRPGEPELDSLREIGAVSFIEKEHVDVVSQAGAVLPVAEEERVRSLLGGTQGVRP